MRTNLKKYENGSSEVLSTLCVLSWRLGKTLPISIFDNNVISIFSLLVLQGKCVNLNTKPI